ncbi:MAG TPA: methyltransferase domain-containing protein [Sporichthya sp.]|nr:methyltransferase domain-containing protein [Sporichthya sp.]
MNLWQLIRDCIPTDHARQVNSGYYLDQALTGEDPPDVVVDLGCGVGLSADRCRELRPGTRWIGVDIIGSPESKARVDTGDLVVHYDGVRLPLASGSVSMIHSHQVFEHVRRPIELLIEISRVLTPGGIFSGSTSHLEPYHSLSVWNYTPYGFRLLVEEAGLMLEEVRPGIDGITLIQRTYKGRPPEYSAYFHGESPLNAEIDAWAAEHNKDAAATNLRKLEHCGQFAFRIRKPEMAVSVPTSEASAGSDAELIAMLRTERDLALARADTAVFESNSRKRERDNALDEIDALRNQLEHQRKRADDYSVRFHKADRDLRVLRNSAAFELGNALVDAAKHPGKGAKQLPKDLAAMRKRRQGKKS